MLCGVLFFVFGFKLQKIFHFEYDVDSRSTLESLRNQNVCRSECKTRTRNVPSVRCVNWNGTQKLYARWPAKWNIKITRHVREHLSRRPTKIKMIINAMEWNEMINSNSGCPLPTLGRYTNSLIHTSDDANLLSASHKYLCATFQRRRVWNLERKQKNDEINYATLEQRV